jgi:hypothetical protein
MTDDIEALKREIYIWPLGMYDAIWKGIGNNENLSSVRHNLSIHEIRMMIDAILFYSQPFITTRTGRLNTAPVPQDEDGRAALAWMKAQAKALCTDVQDDWGPLYLSRVIANHITPKSSPQDWKLVPVEPTQEMLHAMTGETAQDDPVLQARDDYKAMLSAAPELPKPEADMKTAQEREG